MCIWSGVAFSAVTSEYQKGGTGLPQGYANMGALNHSSSAE